MGSVKERFSVHGLDRKRPQGIETSHHSLLLRSMTMNSIPVSASQRRWILTTLTISLLLDLVSPNLPLNKREHFLVQVPLLITVSRFLSP